MNTLASPASDRPLAGLNVVELHAIGPVPFAGMLLRNLGATVTRVSPPVDPGLGVPGKARFDPLNDGKAVLLADKILLMSNGPRARVAEVVVNTMPRDRTRGTIHHDPQYYRIRNHLVDFLVSRAKGLAGGRAPAHPPEVRPGLEGAGDADAPAARASGAPAAASTH